jgi:4-hydroxybenzoate polyprenyltransferase
MTAAAPPQPVTRADPYLARLRAYLRERFPLFGHVLLIVSYFSSNQFLAKVLTQPDEPMRYTARSLLGALTLLFFFFHLRVFDEHKDFAEDSRFHPQRVLQRGVITLGDLRLLAAIAIVAELALAFAAGPAATLALAAAFVFSLLMLKEFFAAEWLRRHFLVYATSHMLLMPLLSLMVFSFTTKQMPWLAPGVFWLYAFVGFFVTFNVEVSRKIRAPEDEIEGLDSYSKIFGTYGAAWIVIALRLVDTTLVSIVGYMIGVSPWFYVAIVLLFLMSLVTFVRFRMRTSAKTAKALERNAGIYLIAFDLILAVELMRKQGFGGFG